MTNHFECAQSRQIDRLVDGERSRDEYRQLLANFDQSPDGWRNIALAFLEAQAWRQEIELLRNDALSSRSDDDRHDIYRQQRVWSTRQMVGLILAMAACFAVAFASGVWWGVGSAPDIKSDRSLTVQPSGDSHSPVHEEPLSQLADDTATVGSVLAEHLTFVVDRVAAKHWIGVHAVPIDDAFKSQFNLEDRLIVRAVMPDSPAAKGGLKQHDILLKFGDRDLKNLEDLLTAVTANEEKTTKIVALRGGKELTLDIQPTERPANAENALQEFDSVFTPLGNWLSGPSGGRFRLVGPGVFEELPTLPGDLSIDITKQNDEPAKVVVKRDDDSWEITENEIDTLPEDLREHVQRQLDHQRGRTHRTLRLRLSDAGEEEIQISPQDLLPGSARDMLREQIERANEQLEQLQKRWSEGDPFKALQEEMKALRREVEKLRARD